MSQQQDKQLRQAPYVYVRVEEVINAVTTYDPTDATGLIDTDGIGKKLKDLFILTDADCTIRFWNYVTGEYRNPEKIIVDVPALWKNELIGLHKITPTGASATIEIHRGSALP